MPTTSAPIASLDGLSPETLLIHGGTLRSGFGELSEAMFVTQSYVYEFGRAGRGALQERGWLHL